MSGVRAAWVPDRWRQTATTPDSDAALLRQAMWRTGLQVALCVAGVVVVLSGLAVLIVLHGQQTDDARLLRQTAARADDVADPPAGMWLAIQTPTGVTATHGLPPGLPDQEAMRRTARTGTAETGEVTLDGTEYRVYTVRHGARTVQVSLDLTPDHRERNRLTVTMLVTGGVGLLFSVGLGVGWGRRAVRPMAAALALQRRFVSDASHELRTPLTLLSTHAQMLRRHVRQGARQESVTREVDVLVGDADHLTDILDDLLLAADTRDQLNQTLDLVVLAEETSTACAAAAARRSVTLTCRPRHASVLVRGTPVGLRRALTALLDNSVRHARTAVTVTVDRDDTSAVVDVTDDGPGIDPTILPHLFERFASTAGDGPTESHTHRRRYGIGLALVSEIAARHDGAISAHQAPGGGATLRLTLPLAVDGGRAG